MRYSRISLLTGMSREQLLAALNQAQEAYTELMTGNKGVSFSYTQGDGTRSLTYQTTDIDKLQAFIMQLQYQLGMIARPRRPITVRY